jgi:hypothetical protein
MQRLLRFAMRNGLTKGFLGGSRPWLVVGGIAVGWRVMRKIAGNEPVVVYSEALKPGESVVIAHGREPR